MPCTYVLLSQTTSKFYIGSSRSDTAVVRLRAHNKGQTRSTKSGRPWVLYGQEYYALYSLARKRELFLKSGQGRKLLKNLFTSGEVA